MKTYLGTIIINKFIEAQNEFEARLALSRDIGEEDYRKKVNRVMEVDPYADPNMPLDPRIGDMQVQPETEQALAKKGILYFSQLLAYTDAALLSMDGIDQAIIDDVRQAQEKLYD